MPPEKRFDGMKVAMLAILAVALMIIGYAGYVGYLDQEYGVSRSLDAVDIR